MLEVSQLTRSYGSNVAVDHVGFRVGRGEIVGLLGHNGAGKTTIMKMLSGYLEPDEGNIGIAGLDLLQQTKQAQAYLGYLPENLPVYPEMAVADYLEFAAQLRGLQGDARRDEIRRVVRATDLGSRLLSPIATLSRGLKQRVGVAQAILGRPRLLILDEPTNGLDPTQTEHMRQLIRELARDATVMLSTHIMQEVDAVCSRVLILRAGQVSVDARLDELRLSNHALLTTSLGADETRSALSSLEGLSGIAPLPEQGPKGEHLYRLEMVRGADYRSLCARISRAVLGTGADLYELQLEHRDLETLFREVSHEPTSTLSGGKVAAGVVNDAA